MGRTNPKLIPFLKWHLEMNSFINLQYELGNIDVFYVELPRYVKDKCGDYEAILKAWYECTGKLPKYIGYSNGKSVFQAALKKSVYLISLPNIGKQLRFRFATSEEVKENKKLSKEKGKSLQPLSPSNPPSVASSGYLSGNDSEAENMQDADLQMPDDMVNEILDNLEYYIGNLDNVFKDDDVDKSKEDLQPQNVLSDSVVQPLQNVHSEAKPMDMMYQVMRPVTELKTIPVGVSGSLKKYWLCTQKIKLKGTLQLICELQVVEDQNSEIKEGSVVIPNDVFEPGVSYNLKKSFELNDLQFYFFTPSYA